VGVPRDALLGRHLTAIVIEPDRSAAWEMLVQTLSGERVRGELHLSAAGGGSRTANIVTAPIAEGGRVTGALGILRDVTDVRALTAEVRAFVRQGAGAHAAVDVNEIIRGVLAARAHAIEAREIELVTRFDRKLPRVGGDPAQLQQVFVHLVGNAENAVLAGEGTRRIEIRTEHMSGHVTATVRDSGVGIPPEHLDRIFHPFVATPSRGPGSGLGLSICDGIVREHGGRLQVQSTPGTGTTFLIELPVWDGGKRQHPVRNGEHSDH
jgi:signal transduction histidine kinase